MAFERLVSQGRCLGSQGVEVTHTVPAQAPVNTRARTGWTKKLARPRRQIVQWQQQGLAQVHYDGLLRRAQGRLQPVRRMRVVMRVLTLFSLVHCAEAHAVAAGVVRAFCAA